MPNIRFITEDKELEIESGTTVLEAARKIGIVIEAPCNCMGTCGKCLVILEKPGSIKTEVLSCQYKVFADIGVIVPNKSDENKGLQILAQGESFSYPLKPYFSKGYGIALDIGTTTLVAELINLSSGEIIASDSMLNPQATYAQDVLTRIHFADKDGGLETLYNEFLTAFHSLIENLCKSAGIAAENVCEVVYSGNTAMLHLATNTDPSPLGKFPYNMNLTGGKQRKPREIGIKGISPQGLVYLPPVISAYVGADITSGILSAQLHKKPGTTLFIDIGTNGEIVVASNGNLAATSTAAGPAFEGMNIACGMRAAPGAIEEFSISAHNQPSLKTIAGEKPVGICGSGLLDIAGELVRKGVITPSGRFEKKSKLSPELAQNLNDAPENHGRKPAFYITDDVFLTQKDVRQIQLAKGAILAGIIALLDVLKISESQVNEVLIAGSFGYHLREESLLNIGLIPRSLKGKVRFVGNTSQSGARAFLLNTDFRKDMLEVVSEIEKIELSKTADFEKLFVDCLSFPICA